MSDDLSPALRRLELGEELRRMREARGKTIEQVSADLSELYGIGFSASKISRLELGRRGANPRDVRDLCKYYGADTEEQDRLVSLAMTSRSDNRLQAVDQVLRQYIVLEARANRLRNYEPTFVPGLLQTVDYHRALADGYIRSGVDPANTEELTQIRIQIRQERQKLLTGETPVTLHSIIDENVVRRQVGANSVMMRQLEHLGEISRRPNIKLQVIPMTAGNYPGCESGFTLVEYPGSGGEEDVACIVDSVTGSRWVDRASDRQIFTRIYSFLGDIAYSIEESRELMRAAADQFRD